MNQQVAKGDRLLVLEAMKMQSTVYAPVSGKVTQILVQVGHNFVGQPIRHLAR